MILIDVNEDAKELDWFPDLNVPVIPFSRAPRDLDAVIATGWQTVPFLECLPAERRIYFVQSDESRFTEDAGLKARILATYLKPFEYMTEARWIQRWLKQEFGHEAVYVPNGLDPEIMHPVAPLEPKGYRLRVLLEGPISIPFKGMADAFAAVRDLDCEVWCVSSHGRPDPDWRCDRFFERVPMTEMKRIYSSCDILLKMSRVEGFFGPPLEMMACGGTSVVAKVTGYDEYIMDGMNALVVEPGDVGAARAAVHRLLVEPALRERLVAAGRMTAKEWRWEPTIDILDECLSGKSPTLGCGIARTT
ncbi:D-inositol-3-phosphate glycosyltransferase [compost metagenome]